MRDHDHGAARRLKLADPLQALLLEGLVAHGEDLVDQEDVGVGVHRHGEGQPEEHARAVVLHLRVDELLDLAEGDDVVEALLELRPGHAEDRAVEEHVLPAREVRVEAGAHLDQPGHAAAQQDPSGIREEHPGDGLEQRRLAGAVEADQPHRLAGVDGEVHVVQRHEGVGELLALQRREHQLLEGAVVAQGEALGDVLDAHHLPVGGDRGGAGHVLDLRGHRSPPLTVPGRSAASTARRPRCPGRTPRRR